MRVLKTVLELRGEKRFRRQPKNGVSVDTRKPDDSLDYNAAKTTIRKMNTKSSYNR